MKLTALALGAIFYACPASATTEILTEDFERFRLGQTFFSDPEPSFGRYIGSRGDGVIVSDPLRGNVLELNVGPTPAGYTAEIAEFIAPYQFTRPISIDVFFSTSQITFARVDIGSYAARISVNAGWNTIDLAALAKAARLSGSRGTGFSFAADEFRVDNFVFGAVPEPSTWAMMVVGFGIVGFAIRRQKRLFPKRHASGPFRANNEDAFGA